MGGGGGDAARTVSGAEAAGRRPEKAEKETGREDDEQRRSGKGYEGAEDWDVDEMWLKARRGRESYDHRPSASWLFHLVLTDMLGMPCGGQMRDVPSALERYRGLAPVGWKADSARVFLDDVSLAVSPLEAEDEDTGSSEEEQAPDPL